MTTRKIALIFPGQGAQAVGMGKELAAEFPVAADVFGQADEILGWPLSKFCWEGPAEELTKTSICQPALFVHGLAALAVVREKLGNFPVAGGAGLSLGEFTAHAAAGTFDFATGLRLVAQRGQFIELKTISEAQSMKGRDVAKRRYVHQPETTLQVESVKGTELTKP